MQIFQRYQTGSNGWNLDIITSTGMVGVALNGPQSKHYDGDFMTPEEAERIAEGLLRAAKEARERVTETVDA